MKTALFFDTETTGLPVWKEPSDSKDQPHLVQLGAIMADLETREVIQTIDLIIKPEDWEIPKEVSEIHGITHEKALEVGVSEQIATEMLIELFDKSEARVAHNRTFDQRIIRIACKRYFDENVQNNWAEKDDFICTMLMSKPIMQLTPKGKYGFKNPRLEEAYKFFTDKDLENAHTAMADAKACMDIYFAMLDYESDK